MLNSIRQSELFDGMADEDVARIAAIAKPKPLRESEYLFLLGDDADRLYVVLSGTIEICCPLALGGKVHDITVESCTAGDALGWSSLVKPYRFTLSARAAEPSELAAFQRESLRSVFDTEPRIAVGLMQRVAEMTVHRFLKMQALWARELQRAVAGGLVPGFAPQTGEGEAR